MSPRAAVFIPDVPARSPFARRKNLLWSPWEKIIGWPATSTRPGYDIFVKNGKAYETTEAAEPNSVSSKRPSHQRDEQTTGCMEEMGRDEVIIDRKTLRKGTM
jgi:hypothetical protein